MEQKKEVVQVQQVKKSPPKLPVRTGLIGLILLAFYALFNYNPFGQQGNNGLTNRHPEDTQNKEIKKEFILKIRNKLILINNQEKQLHELHEVLVDIKKQQGAVTLLLNGEEKAGVVNEVHEQLRKNNILYSESWEPGTEPK